MIMPERDWWSIPTNQVEYVNTDHLLGILLFPKKKKYTCHNTSPAHVALVATLQSYKFTIEQWGSLLASNEFGICCRRQNCLAPMVWLKKSFSFSQSQSALIFWQTKVIPASHMHLPSLSSPPKKFTQYRIKLPANALRELKEWHCIDWRNLEYWLDQCQLALKLMTA